MLALLMFNEIKKLQENFQSVELQHLYNNKQFGMYLLFSFWTSCLVLEVVTNMKKNVMTIYWKLEFQIFYWIWCLFIAFCRTKCWYKFIKGKYINILPMHADRAHYGVCQKKFFILYVRILNVNSSVSIDTYVWTLKTFHGYYC